MLNSRVEEHENLNLRKSQIDMLLEDEKIQKTDMMERIDVAQDDYNDHSKILAASEERVKHLKKSLIDKEKNIERANKENAELAVDIEKRSERLSNLEAELSDLESTNYEQMDFSNLEEKVELLKDQLLTLDEELTEKRRELGSKKEQLQTLDNDAFKNASKLEEYARLLQDLTAEIETLEKSTSNFTDDLIRDRSKVKEYAAKVETLEVGIPNLKKDVETYSIELKNLDVRYRELSKEVIQLDSKRSSLVEINNSAEGRRAGAVELVKKVGDATIEVLGKLIECDPEYAIAVQELVGESLDAVVATSGKDAYANLVANFDATVDLMWPMDGMISAESVGRLETQGCSGLRALTDIAPRLNKILNGFFVVDNLDAELAAKINPEIQFKGLVSRDGKFVIKKVGNSVVFGQRNDEASKADGIIQRNNQILEMGEVLLKKQAELNDLEIAVAAKEEALSNKRAELDEALKNFN